MRTKIIKKPAKNSPKEVAKATKPRMSNLVGNVERSVDGANPLKSGLRGIPQKSHRSVDGDRSKSAKVGLAGRVPPKGHRSVDGAKEPKLVTFGAASAG